MKEYKVLDEYQRSTLEKVLNEFAGDGWKIAHFNSIFARLGNDHRDHHIQFHVILERELKQ